MNLKLLIVAAPLLLAMGGCTVHFPLADNSPSLASQSDGGSDAAAPAEPSTRGNTAATPDLPQDQD